MERGGQTTSPWGKSRSPPASIPTQHPSCRSQDDSGKEKEKEEKDSVHEEVAGDRLRVGRGYPAVLMASLFRGWGEGNGGPSSLALGDFISSVPCP